MDALNFLISITKNSLTNSPYPSVTAVPPTKQSECFSTKGILNGIAFVNANKRTFFFPVIKTPLILLKSLLVQDSRMARKRSSPLRMNPCLRRQVLKTNSYKTIDDILKGKLETIVEEPSPRSNGPVSMKLEKPSEGAWQMKISKIGTSVGAPFSNLGDSYVRTMNEFVAKVQMGALIVAPGSMGVRLT
eukprot:Gb_29700 [translate_table: standard]